MTRPYLSDIIINLKTQGEWKIHLTIEINFISSKDFGEIRIMHSKNDNIELMMGSETDEIIKELSESLLQRYQEGLEESMRGSDFIFDGADILYYNLNIISLVRGESYIDTPECIKNKKATINPKISDSNCFQYAILVALNQ